MCEAKNSPNLYGGPGVVAFSEVHPNSKNKLIHLNYFWSPALQINRFLLYKENK